MTLYNDLPTLVVLGTKSDPHVERVVACLRNRDSVNVFVIDYLDDTRFDITIDQDGRSSTRINGYELPERYLVWDRRKILPGTSFYVRGDETSSGYAAEEWRALYTLICGLNTDRVINSLASRVCMIKPYQQTIAARAGFLVPPSVVTNSKERVVNFQTVNDGGCIMKSLSGGKVKPASEGEYIPCVVMTMRVAQEDVAMADPSQFAICPHFLQREIIKQYELRVIVVGEQIIAFRIDSQRYEMSKVDWRNGTSIVDFERCCIDMATTSKIRAFMRQMGLFTGSIDLIVDKTGDIWFLECNQDGAWGWLDDVAGGAVAEAFANEFSIRLNEIQAGIEGKQSEGVAT